MIIMKKTFKNSSEVSKAISYQLELIELLTTLGFDDRPVFFQEIDNYYGGHRYPDVIAVYIKTEDETLINSLKIVN